MEGIFNYLLGGNKSQNVNITNTQFMNFVKNTKILSQNTKNIYIKRLSTINCEFEPKQTLLYWILHPQEFKKALLDYKNKPNLNTKKRLSAQSISQFLTVMISLILHHQEIQEMHPDLLGQWKKMKNDINEEVIEHYDSNKPNERQAKALFSFKELEEIRDNLPIGSDARLLLSLYTMIPPLRSDFDNVKLYFDTPSHNEGNYILFPPSGDPILVLNIFKTHKVYESIKEKIPPLLFEEIKASLKLKPREYLFVNQKGLPYDKRGSWNVWANRLLKKILKNPSFNLTMFRHIYLSREDLNLSHKTRKERKEISNLMGHSLDQQDKYTWKDTNIKINKE